MNDIQQKESLTVLKKILVPNDTIYGVVRKVSSSGLSRIVEFYAIKQDKPILISYHIANVLEFVYNRKKNGVVIKGCGMDMCWDTVCRVSWQLFGSESKLKTGYL